MFSLKKLASVLNKHNIAHSLKNSNLINNQSKGCVNPINITKKVEVSSEYKCGLFWAKFDKSLILKQSKDHKGNAKNFKKFNEDELTQADTAFNSFIKLMEHPILYKQISDEKIDVLTKTSKPWAYEQFDDQLSTTLIKPYKLDYEGHTGKHFYSSSKVYEMLLKSPQNGDAILNIEDYKHLMAYYNISEDLFKAWVIYFSSIEKNSVIKISDFIKNEYTIKPFLIQNLNNKLQKSEISIKEYLELEAEILSWPNLIIHKDKIINKLVIQESEYLKLKLD